MKVWEYLNLTERDAWRVRKAWLFRDIQILPEDFTVKPRTGEFALATNDINEVATFRAYLRAIKQE